MDRVVLYFMSFSFPADRTEPDSRLATRDSRLATL